MRSLVWFRGKDLRVADHGALCDSLSLGEVVPLFVLDPYFFAPERARELPHRIQFLLESLVELDARISALGSRLLVVKGRSVDVVPKLQKLVRADRVAAYRWSEPVGRKRDALVARALPVPFMLYEGETLAPPGTLRTGGGTPFSVFTPFSRAFRKAVEVPRPMAAPTKLPPLPEDVERARIESCEIPTLNELGIERNPDLVPGGETAARERLRAFMKGAGAHYDTERDRMDHAGTSRLSQDLKFGTLSVAETWWAAFEALEAHPRALSTFTNELLWREFSYATLWDRPELLRAPFRKDFEDFPYRPGEGAEWETWISGRTGYPVVDASARQLLREGFVHNRARMISASFLTKHLLIDYKAGEAHYMKYLTDGDWAANNSGWQWSAGTGCDAQPYFRIFNPVTQGERFDPEGNYVRTYVPELAQMPAKYIHAPWKAPPEILARAKVSLGKTYPEPVVAHEHGRDRFLRTAETARANKKS